MTKLEYKLPKEQRMYRCDIYGSSISRVCEPRDTSHVTTKPYYSIPLLLLLLIDLLTRLFDFLTLSFFDSISYPNLSYYSNLSYS